MIVSYYVNLIIILISLPILSWNLVTQMWNIIVKYPGIFQYTVRNYKEEAKIKPSEKALAMSGQLQCHNEHTGVSNYWLIEFFSTVCSGADQRKHQSPASLAFVRGFHRWPVNSPHKGPLTRKMFPFGYVIVFWIFSELDATSLFTFSVLFMVCGVIVVSVIVWGTRTCIRRKQVHGTYQCPRWLIWFYVQYYPDSKVHGANMGPIWGRQDPGGPHVGPMNLAIRIVIWLHVASIVFFGDSRHKGQWCRALTISLCLVWMSYYIIN